VSNISPELTDPDRLLRLDENGKEIGHSVCTRCGHDRFVTARHRPGPRNIYSCAKCGLADGLTMLIDANVSSG
jgi:hypothetical protein